MKFANPFKIARRYSTPQFVQYALTWRISLLCALMAAFAMIYEIPESAISCYLIIYLMKIDATQNIVIGIAITILLSLTVMMIFIITNLVINSSFLIFVAIFCCSYFLVLLGGIFNVSEVGNLLALVVAFLLTLITDAPTGNIATRGFLYALLMASSPMFLMIIFNLFIGKKSPNILLEKYLYQLSVIGETLALSKNKSHYFDLLLENRSLDCESHLKMMKLFRLKSKEELFFFENCNSNLYKLLALSTILPQETSAETRHILIDHCKKLYLIIESKFSDADQIEDFKKNTLSLNDNLVVNELCKTFNDLFKIPTVTPHKKPINKKKNNSILLSHQFAFKTTISAVFCYFIYTITDWQGIHTAMITCYVVALGTTAETVHKLILRIIGCLLGALIGVLTIIYIVPHTETINGLFILVFIGILIPAWVTSGSELFSYCGVQIGLAFLLTVINGFQPSTDLVTAQDRILGILLGNVICFFVFTYLWPVSISETIYTKITNLLALFKNKNKNVIHCEISESMDVVNRIKNIDYDLKLVIFDTKLMKLSIKELKIMYILIRRLLYFNTLLLLPIESKKDHITQNEAFTFNENKLIDIENVSKINKILNKNIISVIKRI